jgi:hypothetical protein
MAGQTPKQSLSKVRIIYAEGDQISVRLADFSDVDISSWEFAMDVYENGTNVTTFDTTGGHFTVEGAENDILVLDLNASDLQPLVDAETASQEGILKVTSAPGENLEVIPWRFMRVRFYEENYSVED